MYLGLIVPWSLALYLPPPPTLELLELPISLQAILHNDRCFMRPPTGHHPTQHTTPQPSHVHLHTFPPIFIQGVGCNCPRHPTPCAPRRASRSTRVSGGRPQHTKHHPEPYACAHARPQKHYVPFNQEALGDFCLGPAVRQGDKSAHAFACLGMWVRGQQAAAARPGLLAPWSYNPAGGMQPTQHAQAAPTARAFAVWVPCLSCRGDGHAFAVRPMRRPIH